MPLLSIFSPKQVLLVTLAIQLLAVPSTILPVESSSTSTPSSTSTATSAREALEAARYAPLPPTVFAPGGRLHGVERVAREAYPSGEEELSCVVIALKCGGGRDDDGEEFAIMAGIGARSPFLHRDEASSWDDNGIGTTARGGGGGGYMPLVLDDHFESASPADYSSAAALRATPIAILSPSIVAGAGGKGIDSAVLLRRSLEVALSMYRSDNGGVDWFVSHSMEGTSNDNKAPRPRGGAAGVQVASLVRRLADMAQTSTQSLGGRYGRMLSSSLLAIGTREQQTHKKSKINQHNHKNYDDDTNNNDNLVLWRVDPTGQFWRLDASAVGRGAVDVEAELLKRVRSWMESERKQQKQQQQQQPANEELSQKIAMESNKSTIQSNLSNKDVRAYLASLTVEDALEVATNCLIDGVMASIKPKLAQCEDVQSSATPTTTTTTTTTAQAMIQMQHEIGLRRQIQAVIVRSNSASATQSSAAIPRVELVCGKR